MRLSASLDTRARQTAVSPRRRFSLYITLRFLSSAAVSRKGAARNDSKCLYSHLYCTGIFVPMVAQPIQDMSEVRIAHKAVGVRLPVCGVVQ